MKRAVEIATSPEGNTYIQLSDESVKQAKYRSQEARSALLPDIEAQASETTAMKSLSALGLDLATSQDLLAAESGLTGPIGPNGKRSTERNHQRYSARGRTVQLGGRTRQAHAERF